jgi:hypothetical protein
MLYPKLASSSNFNLEQLGGVISISDCDEKIDVFSISMVVTLLEIVGFFNMTFLLVLDIDFDLSVQDPFTHCEYLSMITF